MSAAQALRPLVVGGLQLEEPEFRFFKNAIEEVAGIHLSDSKRELVQARLRSHLISSGFSDFKDYQKHLESLSRTDKEWQVFINLLTTNKTDFFRENAHFHFLKNEFLPKWLAKNERRELKVWCAASSTGEEPYTISMVLAEALPSDRTYSVIATDIDTDVLQKAERAVYPRRKLDEIPEEYRRFCQVGSGEIRDWMRIHPDVRHKVRFGYYNLTSGAVPPGEDFDLVFCRNVLIYFTPSTISGVAKTLFDATRSGGYLLIGHSETLQNIQSSWSVVRPSIYMKRER